MALNSFLFQDAVLEQPLAEKTISLQMVLSLGGMQQAQKQGMIYE